MAKKEEKTSFQHDYLGVDKEALKRSLDHRLTYTVGKDTFSATVRDWYHTAAYAARDRMMERWMETQRSYYEADAKRVYYLSLEFLIGRMLANSMLNVGFFDACREAVQEMGVDFSAIREIEDDAALGNGGLGRLAACFLDSMASLGLPGYGYGIRYEYGMFHQRIEDGWQVEHPDNWLRYGNPWEFPRPEILYPVHFYGHVVEYKNADGCCRYHWTDTEEVMAMAYDTPVPGFGNCTVNNMRLWSAKATRDFDLRYFNEGNYIKAVEDKNGSENLSKVLYPDDTTTVGKELRLKQQYFFVSASLQDVIHRYRKHHNDFDEFHNKAAVQMNDTHPSVAVPELMRLLMDVYELDWDKAWATTTRTFAYTNHTLMPEALETWPVEMFERVLPRHMQIIYEINHRFMRDVMHRHPGDMELLRRMSIIDDGLNKRVRMSHLAIVGSHHVNGVAQIHTDLMRQTIFADFDRFYPDKIINVTNGITPRRWLNQANPDLSALVSSHIGEEWKTKLERLEMLAPLAEQAAFRKKFAAVKRANKETLALQIQENMGVVINPDSLFDVHIKRIHEYKRQLLNVLHVVTRYNRIRSGQTEGIVARTVIFSGKAAPGYAMAKLTIKLINDVADIVNNDPAVGDLLKVIFIPNYNVSTAADIIPAADLSEQISTAGTEASGTGNMKLALNGALTIGTLDGANVEIGQEVGWDNIFIFGLTTDEVANVHRQGYNPWDYYHANAELRQALEMIGSGYFSADDTGRFRPIVDALTHGGDRYLLLADYAAYVSCQERVDALYADPNEWMRRAVINVAHMGKFSSDRSIKDYAEKIWHAKPVPQK
jgi:starch phosphorylase